MTKHAVTTVTTTVKPADPSASHPAPGQDRRGVTVRGHNGHAHLFPLLFGLVDAHVSRVDYFDTVGGNELMRVLRGRHSVHDHPAHRPAA